MVNFICYVNLSHDTPRYSLANPLKCVHCGLMCTVPEKRTHWNLACIYQGSLSKYGALGSVPRQRLSMSVSGAQGFCVTVESDVDRWVCMVGITLWGAPCWIMSEILGLTSFSSSLHFRPFSTPWTPASWNDSRTQPHCPSIPSVSDRTLSFACNVFPPHRKVHFCSFL